MQVVERLNKEINHWDREHNRLLGLEERGQFGRIRAEVAYERARRLEDRQLRRLEELNEEEALVARPPIIRGAALVIPSALLAEGRDTAEARTFARNTKAVERRAVDAVMAAERALGRHPEEMPQNNKGYDIRSWSVDRTTLYHLEVKGRIHGADTFTITTSEVQFAQTQGHSHRLALVSVSPDGAKHDELRYVLDAFDGVHVSSSTASINEVWKHYWQRGGEPV